jgi:DNA-directed RNA polymerase subunit K/omega
MAHKNNKQSNKLQDGGLHIKDDPDKLNKDDFDSNKIDDDELIEDDVEETEEIEEHEEVEEVEDAEKEEFDKEKDDEEGEEGDECLYKITKKKTTIDIELDVVEDNFEEDDEDNKKKSLYVKPDERITKPFLFEFERVRILGERARQLSLGAKPMLKNIENFDPKIIAKMELANKVIPLIILRELPDGRIEKWKVSELSY